LDRTPMIRSIITSAGSGKLQNVEGWHPPRRQASTKIEQFT
jgi:hypothetical protein